MSTKYKVTFKCEHCAHVFVKVLKSLDAPDPACPNLACPGPHFNRADRCSAPAEVIPDPVQVMSDKMDWEAGKAPSVGGSNIAKAVDYTAEVVMQDHGMTDLKDNVRTGETMAPRLTPKLQTAADNFFSPGKKQQRGGMLQGINTAQIARRAMGGAYRPGGPGVPDPVKLVHDAKLTVPVNIINK